MFNCKWLKKKAMKFRAILSYFACVRRNSCIRVTCLFMFSVADSRSGNILICSFITCIRVISSCKNLIVPPSLALL